MDPTVCHPALHLSWFRLIDDDSYNRAKEVFDYHLQEYQSTSPELASLQPVSDQPTESNSFLASIAHHSSLMSLLIRYAHIPFYFRFSFTFPTSPIHPYAPPLRRNRARARMTIALALSDRSRLFDGHMTYDSHVFTSILSVSTVPPPAVRPITRSHTARSGTFYSFAICLDRKSVV